MGVMQLRLDGRDILCRSDVLDEWTKLATIPDHMTVEEWDYLYGPRAATLEELDR